MLKSMTGYGKAQASVGNKKFTIEIKSLNSKQLDVYVKMPSVYKEKELELRSFLGKELDRGKIELTVYYDSTGEDKKVVLNKPLIEAYHSDFKEVANNIGQDDVDFMSLILRIPDVLKTEKAQLDLDEWNAVLILVKEALVGIQDYRKTEGSKIEEVLKYYMGKNTPERQKFIINNLKVEEDLVKENEVIDLEDSEDKVASAESK